LAEYAVRDAQIEDAARIAEIHVLAWRRAYAGLMPTTVLSGLSTAEREVFWRHRLDAGDTTVLVCEYEKHLVGWLVSGPSRDDDADLSVAEIYGMYVDPAHWRRRCGAVLWDAAARRLAVSSFDRVTLWVLEGNFAARRFYEWAGFVLDPLKVKTIEREGVRLPEFRYSREVSRIESAECDS
jgi:GNAT superfamily N-acetyltransferase